MRKCTVTADSTAIPFKTVRKAIAENNDVVLRQLREKILGEMYDTSVEAFDGELMDKLNEVFNTHFVVQTRAKGGQPDFDESFAADTAMGRSQWKLYHAAVIDVVTKYDSIPRAGWPVGASSRIALLLYWSPMDKDLPLPILGELSVTAITKLCASLPLAITEVSCDL